MRRETRDSASRSMEIENQPSVERRGVPWATVSRSLIGIGAILLLVTYQNCTGDLSGKPNSVSSLMEVESGNGEGYGGKLEAEFVSLDKAGKCAGSASTTSPAVKSKIQLVSGRLFQVQTDCATHAPIDVTSAVSFMPHNPRVILSGTQLFEDQREFEDHPHAEIVCRGVVNNDPLGRMGWGDIALYPTNRTVEKFLGGQVVTFSIYTGYVSVGAYTSEMQLISKREEDFSYAEEHSYEGPEGLIRQFMIQINNPVTNNGADSVGASVDQRPYSLEVQYKSESEITGALRFLFTEDPYVLIADNMKCASHHPEESP